MAPAGIQIALSGLQATTRRVAQTSSNLANLNTTGYQPRRVEQAALASGGVAVTGSSPTGSGGALLQTGQALDLAIEGGGFFVLADGQGGSLYTRAGNFQQNAQGRLVGASGRALQPALDLPAGTAQVAVSAGGQVQALSSQGEVLGEFQLETAMFGNPAGLSAVGGNAYQATVASGPPGLAAPGEAGHGEIVAGALQTSGTDLLAEMVNLVVEPRVFEANLKAIATQDQMLGTVLDLKA